jgi:anaerobic magnesium-protoporphyrin IX monomethyl ester cyclase
MKVLFGQSYFLRFDPKLWQAMQPYPPLGSLYAASYLRSRGYDVVLFDAMLAESETEWATAIESEKPHYAVLFEDNFNYLSKMCLLRMREAAWRMIAMAKQRGCTVILCGADASDHAADYLIYGADYVLLGEGEVTLGELMDSLTRRTRQALKDILGLAYKSSGKPCLNARRPDIHDLDALPFPAWDLVDVERYRSIWMERQGYFSMNIVTTRGCPFHCNWCAKPIWGQRYNSRSPENVVAEMRWLKEVYHPDHLAFVDDIFGLKPGWISLFAELVNEEGARIPFKCLNRVDLLLRPGEVDALAQAGAQTVWVGAESGSQKILDAMDKGTQVDQIYNARQLLKKASIQAGFFLQFGYPGETRADIEATIRMVRKCAPDDIGFSVSYPLPGTKFYAAVRDQLGKKQNWRDSDDLAMLYHGSFSTAFYRQLHRVVHKEFRARKAWLKLKDGGSAGHTPSWKQRLRSLARFVYGSFSLPFARWQLNRLAASSPGGFNMLPHMAPEAAASPTPQDKP